jgi:hypothetical protein
MTNKNISAVEGLLANSGLSSLDSKVDKCFNSSNIHF